MIEDKEAYRVKSTELFNKKEDLFESLSYVNAVTELMQKYNAGNLSELKEKLDAEYDAAEQEYEKYTKEENETFGEICKKFSSNQIECWFAQGYDIVDLVHSYLYGELK